MNLVLLGRGKTGSLVAEVARERGHVVRILCSADNSHASALTAESLQHDNIVIDFTTPHSVMENIEACLRARKNIVVGATGWYQEIPRVRQLVESSGIGLQRTQPRQNCSGTFLDLVGVRDPVVVAEEPIGGLPHAQADRQQYYCQQQKQQRQARNE